MSAGGSSKRKWYLMLLNALPFRLSLLQISPCSPLSLALFAFLILQCLSSLWDYKLWKDKNLWILVSAMSPRALSQCRTYRRCSRYACLVAEWRTEGEFGVAGESKPSFLSVIPDNFALVWVLAHPHIANLFFLFLTTPMSCGVLVPQPGIEPVPLALEGRVLTTGLLGKSPLILKEPAFQAAAGWFPQRAAGHFPMARFFAQWSVCWNCILKEVFVGWPETWAIIHHLFLWENAFWAQVKLLTYKLLNYTLSISGGLSLHDLVFRLLFIQFSSVAQSCPTPCDPMNHSTPGLTQTHVHWVGDAIQPSHPLSSPSPPAPKPSQHQSLFQWVNSSHEVAKVLEFQL